MSADSSNPTTTPVEFGDIDTSYQAAFQPFSAPRIMTVRGGHALELTFVVEPRAMEDHPPTSTATGAPT